jgi:hypothetical protein
MAEINIGGPDWQAIQSNGWRATFDLAQNAAGKLSGSARASHPTEAGFTGDVDESVSKVSGGSALIAVDWHNTARSRGIYSGNFNLQRTLVGVTFDEAHPTSQATWFSNKSF